MNTPTHSALRSSWRQEVFKKSKTKGIVVKNFSKHRRNNVVIKVQGQFVHEVHNPNFY